MEEFYGNYLEISEIGVRFCLLVLAYSYYHCLYDV